MTDQVAAPKLDVAGAFPTLEREGLVYLDCAATSQTPLPVLAAMDDYYRNHRASVHRGVYPLAQEATDLYEDAEPAITGFDGEALLVHGATGDYRVPLDGSAPTRTDGGN